MRQQIYLKRSRLFINGRRHQVLLIAIGAGMGLCWVMAKYLPIQPTALHAPVWQVVGLAPLLEETVFRGWLWQQLGQRFGWRLPAIWVCTTVLFILGHSQYCWQTAPDQGWKLVYLLLASSYLGGLRAWSGRIWPGILVHVFNNALLYS